LCHTSWQHEPKFANRQDMSFKEPFLHISLRMDT